MNRKVWGHRGCRGAGNPPENSLSAFQWALEAGAGGIELDVYLSQDKVPVVFHDPTLDRMVGVTGKITSLTLSQIKKFHLVSAAKRTSRETIPTLAEVLDLVNRYRLLAPSVVVNIELKDPRSIAPVVQIISQRLLQGWTLSNFLVSSFDIQSLRDLKALLPEIRIGTLFECSAEELPAKIAEVSDLNPASINIPAAALTPESFERIAAAGATPVIWTPNEVNPNQLSQSEREKLLRHLREREFVAITDFPKDLLQWLKPSKAKATITGVLAACLAISQQDMLFRPTESGLETLKAPSDYPELAHFGFHELRVTAKDGVSLKIWERLGGLDRPHYLLFHGIGPIGATQAWEM